MVDISTSDLNRINTILASGQDYWKAYDILADYQGLTADQRFWFEQASTINRMANGFAVPVDQNSSGRFILDYSAFGLAMDGRPASLAETSNAIAQNVLREILEDARIRPLKQMVGNDIGAALDAGGQTLGGWAGSFYYWDVVLPAGFSGATPGQTVGQFIQSDAVELEKFLASATVATISVAHQELGENVGANRNDLILTFNTILGADVPVSLQTEIIARLVDYATYGQLVTSDLTFGGWTYDSSDDTFFKIAGEGVAGYQPGDRIIASGPEAEFLEERLQARLLLEEAGLDHREDIEALLVKVADDLDQPFCFPAGTLIALTLTETCFIEDLVPGDTVLAFDPLADLGRGALVPKRVVRLFHNETEEWLRLTWQAEGETQELTVTPGHRFLDSHGHFRRIDEIIQDERPKIVLEDGSLATVSAERIVWSEDTRHLFEEVETVAMAAGDGLTHRTQGAWRSYNFEVEDLHTYVAGGARVHNDSQATIDLAGNIGRTFGTMLAGVLLENENQFTQVLGGTVLGLITENLSEVIADTGFHLFDGTQLDFGSSVETAMRQLEDVDAELLAGLSSAASSLLLAELGEELGLEGFGAQLFNTVGSTYLGSVSEQVAGNLLAGDAAFQNVQWDVPLEAFGGAVGAFFGSSLAHELLPAETLEGSIGGSLGSIVGSSLGFSYLGGSFGSSLGVAANFILPGVGAFLGTLLGTFLGDLFGDDPDPGADFLLFAEKQGEVVVPGVYNYFLYATARDGFPTETTRALGQAVTDLSKKYMSSIGAYDMANAHIDNFTLPSIFLGNDVNNLGSNPLIRVLQRMNIEVDGNDNLQFFVNGRQVDSAEAMVDGAVTDFLRDAQPIGGDIFLKRAVVNSTGNDSITLASAMATAAEYENYLANKEVINALIAGSDNTAFSGAWAYTLASAETLDLAKVDQGDFNGGLGGFLASLVDAEIAVDFANVSVSRGNGNKVVIDVPVDDVSSIPTYVNLFANGAEVTETASGATIRFTFNGNMSAVGYKNLENTTPISGTSRLAVKGESKGRDLWIAPDGSDYEFTDIGTHTIKIGDAEIESSDDIIIARGGNDIINAGTGWDWVFGGAGRDTIHGGDQEDIIFGGAGNDIIYGGNQMDYLEGGAGADIINGISPNEHLAPETNGTDYAIAGYRRSNAAVQIDLGAGTATGGHAEGDQLSYIVKLVGSNFDDTLVGDDLPNWLEGGKGADILDGGIGDRFGLPDYASYFYASAGVTASLADQSQNTGDAAGDTYISIEALQGSNFDDILIGDSQNNYLSGYAGDDILVAGEGVDSIRGGLGFDILSYRGLTSGVVINLANWGASSAVVADDLRYNYTQPNQMDIEAYEGTDFQDTLLGSSGNDVLLGRSGADTFEGGAGHDQIYGGAHGDTINSGEGDDIVWGDNGRDTIYLGSGNDTFHDNGQNDSNGDDYVDGQAGDDTLNGGGGNDTLLGGAGKDTIEGGIGDDEIRGGSDYDTIQAGDGDDTVWGDDGRDTIYLGAGNDVFHDNDQDNTHGHDYVDGQDGDDTLNGGGGNDTLFGGSGNDIVEGGIGNDEIRGGSHADTIRAGNGNDTVWGDDGRDTIYLGSGEDIFHDNGQNNGNGRDYVEGQAGNDTLNGGGGDDTLLGGYGKDVVKGGIGDDILDGGRHNDTLSGGAGNDIFVFNTGSPLGNDVITDFVRGEDLLQMSGVDYGDLSFAATGSGVRVEWTDGSVKLDDVTKASITASDFEFV